MAVSMEEKCVLCFFKVDIFAHQGLEDMFCHIGILERRLTVFLSRDVGEKTENRPSEHLNVWLRFLLEGAVLGFLIGHFKSFTII